MTSSSRSPTTASASRASSRSITRAAWAWPTRGRGSIACTGRRRRSRSRAGRRAACRCACGCRSRPSRGSPRMAEIRVVVADDEPLARHGVVGLLAGQADIAVVGEARNGSEAVDAIRGHRPDLVFLDVQMPELDGFEVVRQLPAPLPLIVFITAFDAYAVRAFELAAIDYLVKPF